MVLGGTMFFLVINQCFLAADHREQVLGGPTAADETGATGTSTRGTPCNDCTSPQSSCSFSTVRMGFSILTLPHESMEIMGQLKGDLHASDMFVSGAVGVLFTCSK